jgi:hypothetical protein
MTPEELTSALRTLRENDQDLIKTAAIGSKIKDVWKAIRAGSETAAKSLEAKGFHPAISTAVRYSPHAAAAVGAKKTWESEPVQKMRYKFRLWQARRAARQQGGYY